MLKRVFLAGICLAFICGQITAQTPQQQLLDAAGKGNTQQVQALLDQKVPIETKDPFTGHTPLIAAALSGNAELVSLLIEKKANVNAADKDGDTALMAGDE
jgi:ankyrin repeat protein